MLNDDLKDLGPLATQFPSGGLFATWLGREPFTVSPTATAELLRLDAEPPGPSSPPLWQEAAFKEQLPAAWCDLPHGPDVVVTGQQPGFLGGPLLTLYKIATAVALAQELSERGQPTVPVFWSGDDDDDLVEALATVGWNPAAEDLTQSPDQQRARQGGFERGVLAELGPEIWAVPALASFDAGGGGVKRSARVRAVLEQAVVSGQKWGPGQADLIKAVFHGAPLVVVRGNDPRLQGCAAPFYRMLTGRLSELAELARERGVALTQAGYHAQINERSLTRSLFRVSGQQRRFAPDFSEAEAEDLRPGVMLRSPLQDWLMRPAAVVVGPGELAYLRQLDPLYRALDIPRSPLVPRLSAWTLPQGDDLTALVQLVRNAGELTSADPELLADQVATAAGQELENVLVSELGVSQERAAGLAAGRARRFRKGVVAMLGSELVRAAEGRLAEAPAWVFPKGKRQERSLGLVSALGLWGEDLVSAALRGAAAHLAAGRRGQWREWALLVPERKRTS